MADREYHEMMSNINKTDTLVTGRRILMCCQCRNLGEGFQHFEVKEVFARGGFHYFPVHRNRLLCEALGKLKDQVDKKQIQNPFDV